ncbi:MAG TPA: SRPBCC family protein [Anaerolineales bacterium]|nr:SRPBCC family protein [Anaerolineales bacterium]
MKFRLELPIDKPLTEVWKAFDSAENLKEWQPSLIKFEHVSGTPGQPGAVSELTYNENEREFTLTEEITLREEPHRFDGVYKNEFSDSFIRNTFVEKGENETLWMTETDFKFKTLPMKIMGPLMKRNFVRRTYRDMERFKDFVEGIEGEQHDDKNS